MLKTPLFLSVFVFSLTKLFAEPCTITKFDEVAEATRNCRTIDIVNLIVPGEQTLKLNLTDGAVVTFRGRTIFEYTSPWKGPLVTINGTNVTILGEEGHIFDGQGQYYWDGHGDSGVSKPQFFTVQTFGGSSMRDIYVLNSPHDVLQVTNSDQDEKGKHAGNTDGFDIWNSTNVIIQDSVAYTQDDCVAVRCGANISVHNLECHGTHGLSISVGFSNETTLENPLNTLTNVYFGYSKIYGGRNAIHIKTHNKGGYGLIENVFYEKINVTGVLYYGILIEQNYPNHGELLNNVPIKNLLIQDIYGNIEPDALAVSVACAENGCENWFWENIELKGSTKNNSCNYKPFGSSVCDD